MLYSMFRASIKWYNSTKEIKRVVLDILHSALPHYLIIRVTKLITEVSLVLDSACIHRRLQLKLHRVIFSKNIFLGVPCFLDKISMVVLYFIAILLTHLILLPWGRSYVITHYPPHPHCVHLCIHLSISYLNTCFSSFYNTFLFFLSLSVCLYFIPLFYVFFSSSYFLSFFL